MKTITSTQQVRDILTARNLTALELRAEIESDLNDHGWVKEENRRLYSTLETLAVENGEFSKWDGRVKVEAQIKKIHTYTMPLLVAEFEKGYKLKDSGELYKTDNDRIKTLVKTFSEKFDKGSLSVRGWREGRCFILKVRAQYQNGLKSHDLSGNHKTIDQTFYVYDLVNNAKFDRNCYTAHTKAQFIKAEKDLKKYQDKSWELKGLISNCINILGR